MQSVNRVIGAGMVSPARSVQGLLRKMPVTVTTCSVTFLIEPGFSDNGRRHALS
jgi:hypothetical protein